MAQVPGRGWPEEERCGSCLRRYGREGATRCVACDEPICPHCADDDLALARRLCGGCVAASECDDPREHEQAGL